MYLQHWHGWCHMKLLPPWHILCTPYNHEPCHFMQSHICQVYAFLAVTCQLHFWQNDWGLLCATVVTLVWNGYRNKSQDRKLTLEKKILLPLLQGFKPTTFQSQVWCSNHWAIPAPFSSLCFFVSFLLLFFSFFFIFCHAAGQIVIQNKARWPVFLSHPFVSVLSFLFCPLTDFSTSLFLSLIFLTCSSTFLPLICLRLCHSLYLSFLFFNFFSHLTSVDVAWVVLT